MVWSAKLILLEREWRVADAFRPLKLWDAGVGQDQGEGIGLGRDQGRGLGGGVGQGVDDDVDLGVGEEGVDEVTVGRTVEAGLTADVGLIAGQEVGPEIEGIDRELDHGLGREVEVEEVTPDRIRDLFQDLDREVDDDNKMVKRLELLKPYTPDIKTKQK